MDCNQCKHKDVCGAYKTNNMAIINRCKDVRDTDNKKGKHIKDSTELSGGHMW